MNLLDVIKANIFGDIEAKKISDAQLANYLAIDIFEREYIEASEVDINFLEKRLRATLCGLNKSLCNGEITKERV